MGYSSDHQRPKIEQLAIRQWIPDQYIFISEEMGIGTNRTSAFSVKPVNEWVSPGKMCGL